MKKTECIFPKKFCQRRVEFTDEITLYNGEYYENISIFNFFTNRKH